MSNGAGYNPWSPESEVAQLRIPPNDIHAEAAVLGALLNENAAWDRVSDLLAEGDFYQSENREIFAAMSTLLGGGKVADVITVYAYLETKGRAEDVGGFVYLNSLAQTVPSASAIRRHAEIVRERSILRKLAATADEIAAAAFNPQGKAVDQLLDEAQQSICAISEATSRAGSEWVGVMEGMVEHTGLLERRHQGEVTAWPTGLIDLDEYLEGGLRPGELVIVGARPSQGKTALGLTIAVHMARERPVAFLSMEMSRTEVLDRLTAMLGNVSMSAVKRPSLGDGLAWDRVAEGLEKAKHLKLRISERGGLNINQVRTMARNAKRSGGLDVLVVDYIGLMVGMDAKASRNAQLGEISRGLKTLAKELQVCVLCLAQLNRAAEERPEAMPQMKDLRDSGEIEQDADVILFIRRPILTNPELGPEWQHYAKLSVAKNRQGRRGYLDLAYIGEQTRFTGWSGPAPVRKVVARPTTRGMQDD